MDLHHGLFIHSQKSNHNLENKLEVYTEEHRRQDYSVDH